MQKFIQHIDAIYERAVLMYSENPTPYNRGLCDGYLRFLNALKSELKKKDALSEVLNLGIELIALEKLITETQVLNPQSLGLLNSRKNNAIKKAKKLLATFEMQE